MINPLSHLLRWAMLLTGYTATNRLHCYNCSFYEAVQESDGGFKLGRPRRLCVYTVCVSVEKALN